MICRPLKLRWIMFPSTSKVREIARKTLLKSVHYNTIKTTELTTRIDEKNTRSGKIISKVRQARLPSTNLGTTENLQHHRLFIVIMHISQRNILGESWGALELLYTFKQPICCCSYHYVLFFIVCLICLFPLFSSSVFFIKCHSRQNKGRGRHHPSKSRHHRAGRQIDEHPAKTALD